MKISVRNNEIRTGSTVAITVTDGVPPYNVDVESGGAGGVITVISEEEFYYTAPMFVPNDVRFSQDVITATDDNGETVSLTMEVLIVEQLVADIIQKDLGLGDSQVIIGNERFDPPNDNKLYVTVLVSDGKPYSNNKKTIDSNGDLVEVSSMNMRGLLTINLYSSSFEILQKRYDVIMSLNSDYATKVMNTNSFSIAPVPMNVINASEVEGASIPYKFNISTFVHYGIERRKVIEYFETINTSTTVNK